MPDISHIPQSSSTEKLPSSEKLAGAHSRAFERFILRQRGYQNPRGNLIALFKTLSHAKAFPAIERWADLARLVRSRSASNQTQARKLWNEFKNEVKNKNPERDHHHDPTSQ